MNSNARVPRKCVKCCLPAKTLLHSSAATPSTRHIMNCSHERWKTNYCDLEHRYEPDDTTPHPLDISHMYPLIHNLTFYHTHTNPPSLTHPLNTPYYDVLVLVFVLVLSPSFLPIHHPPSRPPSYPPSLAHPLTLS